MPKPIPRVMMALPRYPFPIMGGLERQAHELAKALRLAGAGVQAISGTFNSSQPQQEKVEGVLVHRIPWPASKAIRFLRTPFDVFYVLYSTRKSYDVIHLHQHSLFGLFTILCAKLLGKPILVKLPNVGKYGIPGMLEEFSAGLGLQFCLSRMRLWPCRKLAVRSLRAYASRPAAFFPLQTASGSTAFRLLAMPGRA